MSPTKKMVAYKNFYQGLIDILREKYGFTTATRGQFQDWYGFSSGLTGVKYEVRFVSGDRLRISVYINRGKLNDEKKVFDWLKQQCTSDFCKNLCWERRTGKKECQIALYGPGSIDSDKGFSSVLCG